MNSLDIQWFGDLVGTDVKLLERAPGGALSEAGRQAAVEASLSLLGVYFATGDQELVERSGIGRSTYARELDALLAGLRLRVAIAAGRRLAGLLDAIVKRPTFRYQLQSTEHMGSLSGALDINRWTTQPRNDQELTFPVYEVQRGLHTPENLMATYAVKWLVRELHASLGASLATPDVVEYRAVRQLRDRLARSTRLPALAECVRTADTIRTRAAAVRLLAMVKRRLRRREIANARPYGELASWIERCLNGQPAVAAGDIDLSVYGDRFDSKLFELWCLGTLGRELSTALRLPEPIVDQRWRQGAPAYSISTFSGRIELYFQHGLHSVDERHDANWLKSNGRRLGGIPDIVVKARPTIGDNRFAIIDPKLRQRDRLPAEELYKVLGYLQNFDVSPPVGIVFIYTTLTDKVTPDIFHDDTGGTLMSISVNPHASASTTADAFREVVRTLLELIDYQMPATHTEERLETDKETVDERAERVIGDVRSSVTAWGRAHLGEIASSRERLKTLIGEFRWLALDDDVQIMMATADLIGHQLDPLADFSGPAIGMCAAVEHVLYASTIAPIVGADIARQKQTRTFGAVLDAIELACTSQGNQLHREIRTHLLANNVDLNKVLGLLAQWRRLNRAFRIPAAHRQVLSKMDWQQLYRMLMGTDSLFIHTCDTLHQLSECPG